MQDERHPLVIVMSNSVFFSLFILENVSIVSGFCWAMEDDKSDNKENRYLKY